MLSTYVLVFALSSTNLAGVITIPNLANSTECNRVAEIIKKEYNSKYISYKYNCIEVLKP